MKERTRNILIASNILLLVLAIFLFSRLQENKTVSLDTQYAYQDSLSGYKYLAQANALLLEHRYPEALAAYSQADSMLPGQFSWQKLGRAYIQQSQTNQDSLQGMQRHAAALQREALIAAKQQELAQRYLNHLQQQTNLDSVQILDFAITKLQLHDEIELLTDELAIVKKQLSQVKDTYGRLSFIYDANGKHVNYYGQVVDSMANGYGIGIFDSKGIYVGEWKDGLRHGPGKYTWANGDIYEGTFNEGKREGEGTYAFLSGEKYEGGWQNDVREGKGTFYSPDGKVLLAGIWRNDEFQRKPQPVEQSANNTTP